MDEIFTKVCNVHNLKIHMIRTLLATNPTAAMRSLYGSDNIMATFKGQHLILSLCTQISPSNIIWSQKTNDKCYKDVPLQVEGTKKPLFIEPVTRVLNATSDEILCSSIIKPLNGTEAVTWNLPQTLNLH
uniref:Uncharacterized protein n=1 Tax=Ditylenchus dipsaci TaxID=166011 RepID=A0A915DN06_9BILA